jgi:hypothetical protein
MTTSSRTEALIALLRNRAARVDERDDAAIDLGESSEGAAFRALFEISTSLTEPSMLQASAGESVAMIWLRNGLFRREQLDRMAPAAKAEAEALIRRQRPEWLDETQAKLQ